MPIHKDAQKYVMMPKELLLEERLVMSEEERKMVSEAVELFEGAEKKKVQYLFVEQRRKINV